MPKDHFPRDIQSTRSDSWVVEIRDMELLRCRTGPSRATPEVFRNLVVLRAGIWFWSLTLAHAKHIWPVPTFFLFMASSTPGHYTLKFSPPVFMCMFTCLKHELWISSKNAILNSCLMGMVWFYSSHTKVDSAECTKKMNAMCELGFLFYSDGTFGKVRIKYVQ